MVAAGGYLVKACTVFSAAHRIHGHPRCGRVHGHNYRVCIVLRETRPLEVDLDDLEAWLRERVYGRFDHQYLNELLGLETVTSEDLARISADELSATYPGRVVSVEVCETPELCVEYRLEG